MAIIPPENGADVDSTGQLRSQSMWCFDPSGLVKAKCNTAHILLLVREGLVQT